MSASDILRAACGERFTAAVLRVEACGRLVAEEAFGTMRSDVASVSTDVTTRFDLASLTKPFVATAVLQACAADEGTLDAPLTGVFPEWKGRPHAAITLRMLLAHTGGLQSGADYRELLDDDVERFALVRDLVAAPGERVIYSDLGFIVLGAFLARRAGISLQLVMDRLCETVGARGAAFRPHERERAHIPATECDGWRGRVQGAVHDEKAHLMGGVAGHAGLFGTAFDVARLTDAFLGPLCGRAPTAIGLRQARLAVEQHGADAVLRRGLGWALKTSDENSCGRWMSRGTFGHTGFTGTSVWADPQRDLSIVLLTNALYFGRRDLRDVRAAVCEAVVEEVDRCARSA